ncbi:MAG: HAD family hydrolase [Candidatus Omnitrophica bacterium]|nr:HAD family hydrolase [Candidatus Omnitrophota bacterium]
MENKFNKKIFIFDLDGTLVDAYQAIFKSLNFTRKQIGLAPVSYKEAKRKVGRGDKRFMREFFSKNDFKRALIIYRRHHKQSLKRYSRLKPYARYILSILKKRKKILAIASNRPKYFTDVILKCLKIKKYFSMVVCADQIKSVKPNPKILYTILKRFNFFPQDAVYVGDMAIDLEAAKRARIDAVFVKGGSSSLREIKRYSNKHVISLLKEILDLYE